MKKLLVAATCLMPLPALAQVDCQPETNGPEVSPIGGHVPGIYVASSNLPLNLPPVGDPRRDTVQSCTWSDARVLGGNIIVPWSKFDRGPDFPGDRFDYTWAEEQINLWADGYGKKVNLLVWSSAQQAQQQFDGESMTPQWLFDLGVPTVTCDPDGDGPEEAFPTIPQHNNGVVRNQYQIALRAIYNRYKDDPRINYVRFGAGVGSENYPINQSIQTDGACRGEWSQVGGGPDAWKNHVAIMIDFFGELQNEADLSFTAPDSPDTRSPEARDNAPIVVSLNDYKGTTVAPEPPRAAFNEATLRRLGIGTQGPTDRHRRNYQDGRTGACTANWCQIFDDARTDPRIPILEIQTPNATGPLGLSPDDGTGPGYTPTGPLQTLAPFLLERGATSFELYPAEFRIANDAGGNIFYDDFNVIYDDTMDAIAAGARQNAIDKSGAPEPEVDPDGPLFGTEAIDEIVRRDGVGFLPYTGTDAGKQGTGLRLTSFGKIFDANGEAISAVFRVRNSATAVQDVILRPVGGADIPVSVPAQSEAYIASPVAAGSATHKLILAGGEIDVKASSQSVYDDSRLVLTAEAVPVGSGAAIGATATPQGSDTILTLTARGTGFEDGFDEGGYLRRTVETDASLTALVSLDEAPAGASAGLLYRAGGAGTGGGTKSVGLFFEPGLGVNLYAREDAGTSPVLVAADSSFAGAAAVYLKLERSGNSYAAFARTSTDDFYTEIGRITGAFPGGAINEGLAVASGDPLATATATFTNAVSTGQ